MNKVYTLEASGKHPIANDHIIRRHAVAFTKREDAEAEKEVFRQSVADRFCEYYGIWIEVVELEVR